MVKEGGQKMAHASIALVDSRWVAADYRRNARDTEADRQAQHSLAQAGDAIRLAILTIAHHVGEEGRERLLERISRVQEHLVDACKALTQAKLYIAGLWTYAPEVILNQDPIPEREIARLNRITTTLAMRNHAHLPQSPKAAPLSAQEEAQLLAVSHEVSPKGRTHRMSVVASFVLAFLCLVSLPWAGLIGGGFGLCFAILGVSRFRSGQRPQFSMLPPAPAR